MQRQVLRSRRVSLGLTQEQVARQLGVTTAFYNMIERGRRNPRLSTAFEIARIMQATVPDVFPEMCSEPVGGVA